MKQNLLNYFLFVLVFVFWNCSSYQKSNVSNLEPIIENTKSEIENSSLDEQTKKRWNSTLESLREENRTLRKTLNDRDKKIGSLEDELQSIQENLTDVSRDAGKSDGMENIGLLIVGILFTLLFAYALYLIGIGKIRIPFLAG